MIRSFPAWLSVCVVLASLAAGVGIDRLAIWYHHFEYTPMMRRDLNELYRQVTLGQRRQDVIRQLGAPTVVTTSLADLSPYDVSPPKAEQVLLYAEYPWGILVYVDKKNDGVSRIILVRHQ